MYVSLLLCRDRTFLRKLKRSQRDLLFVDVQIHCKQSKWLYANIVKDIVKILRYILWRKNSVFKNLNVLEKCNNYIHLAVSGWNRKKL